MSDQPLSTMASAPDFGSGDTGSTPVGAAEPYLILHKVRGEPAFDIAINIGDETGDMWIIPTSGHRAYPYQVWPLYQLASANEQFVLQECMSMPEDWPDHYTVSEDKGYGHKEFRKSAVSDLLKRIGHAKPALIRRAVRK